MLSDFKKFKEKQVLCEFYLDPDDLSKFCVGLSLIMIRKIV